MLQAIFVFLYKLCSLSMSNFFFFFPTSQKKQDDPDLELYGEKFTSPYI